MTFTDKRELIVKALKNSGIKKIVFNKDDIPNTFPAAVVILEEEKGIAPTSHRFCEFDYNIAIYLIEDVNNTKDPDIKISKLAGVFKAHYREIFGKDVSQIEYYSARADASRKVKIAKINTVAQ